MKYFRLAFGFLTVLPVPRQGTLHPGDLGRSAGWFSWIGALIGVIVASIGFVSSLALQPLVVAALSTLVWVALTGGLHLDGLADCCDGMMNAAGKERRLEIMKDPRLGTFGGIGLILVILLKFACLYSLPVESYWLTLPLAAGLGRWLLLWAGKQPLARPEGMGADFAGGLNTPSFFLAGTIVAALAILSGWRGLMAVTAAHLVAWLIFRMARVRLGGVTGDVFGMTVELAEITTLLAFCVRL